MKWNFCHQNPWLGGYLPQIPVLSVLCPQLNLLNLPPTNNMPGYATAVGLLLLCLNMRLSWLAREGTSWHCVGWAGGSSCHFTSGDCQLQFSKSTIFSHQIGFLQLNSSLVPGLCDMKISLWNHIKVFKNFSNFLDWTSIPTFNVSWTHIQKWMQVVCQVHIVTQSLLHSTGARTLHIQK